MGSRQLATFFFAHDDQIDCIQDVVLGFVPNKNLVEDHVEQLHLSFYYLKLACVYIRHEYRYGRKVMLKNLKVDVLLQMAGVHVYEDPRTHVDPAICVTDYYNCTPAKLIVKLKQLFSATFGVGLIPLDYIICRSSKNIDFYLDFSNEPAVTAQLNRFNLDVEKDDMLLTVYDYDNAKIWRMIVEIIKYTCYAVLILGTQYMDGYKLFSKLEAVCMHPETGEAVLKCDADQLAHLRGLFADLHISYDDSARDALAADLQSTYEDVDYDVESAFMEEIMEHGDEITVGAELTDFLYDCF